MTMLDCVSIAVRVVLNFVKSDSDSAFSLLTSMPNTRANVQVTSH